MNKTALSVSAQSRRSSDRVFVHCSMPSCEFVRILKKNFGTHCSRWHQGDSIEAHPCLPTCKYCLNGKYTRFVGSTAEVCSATNLEFSRKWLRLRLRLQETLVSSSTHLAPIEPILNEVVNLLPVHVLPAQLPLAPCDAEARAEKKVAAAAAAGGCKWLQPRLRSSLPQCSHAFISLGCKGKRQGVSASVRAVPVMHPSDVKNTPM